MTTGAPCELIVFKSDEDTRKLLYLSENEVKEWLSDNAKA